MNAGQGRRTARLWEPIVLGFAVVVAVLSGFAIHRVPVGNEASAILAANGVLRHASTRFDRKDLLFFARHDVPAPAALRLSVRPSGTTYAASSLYAILLATGLGLFRDSPFAAAALVNSLLLAWTLLLLSRARRGDAVSSRWLFAAMLVFGSVTFAQVFLAQPTLLACALLASAWFLVVGKRHALEAPIAEVYELPLEPPRWKETLRWLVVGALIALAGTLEPAYWLFLAGAAMLLPRYRRRRTRLALLAGLCGVAVLILLFPSLISGWAGTLHTVALSAALTGGAAGVGRSIADASRLHLLLLSIHWPGFFVRDLFYFLVGRNLGVLPYFLPLVALLAALRTERDRFPILAAALAAAVFLVASRPFDFAGLPGTVGNRLFLPIYASLWFLPAASLKRGWSAGLLVAAGVFLYPIWLSPLVSALPVHGHWAYPSYLAERYLPFEETQSGVPAPSTQADAMTFKVARGSLLRATSPVVIGTRPDGRAELVVESVSPIDSLYVESSETPPEALDVRGARLSETMFRADGRVVFHLALAKKGYERPRASGSTTSWVYTVKLLALGSAPKGYALALSPDAAGSWSPFASDSQ